MSLPWCCYSYLSRNWAFSPPPYCRNHEPGPVLHDHRNLQGEPILITVRSRSTTSMCKACWIPSSIPIAKRSSWQPIPHSWTKNSTIAQISNPLHNREVQGRLHPHQVPTLSGTTTILKSKKLNSSLLSPVPFLTSTRKAVEHKINPSTLLPR
jgi:hypothetical protein